MVGDGVCPSRLPPSHPPLPCVVSLLLHARGVVGVVSVVLGGCEWVVPAGAQTAGVQMLASPIEKFRARRCCSRDRDQGRAWQGARHPGRPTMMRWRGLVEAEKQL